MSSLKNSVVYDLEEGPNHQESSCKAWFLGSVNYEDALKLQRHLVEARLNKRVTDSLLLLEHPSVVTVGKSGGESHLLVPREFLSQKGISLFYTQRGGDITVHSSGQLIGYPIIDLESKNLDPHSYVGLLEEMVIRTLKGFSISGQRLPGHRGVWVGGKKICALGIQLTHWVTSHGFALNVNNDLTYFSYVIPCGIGDKDITSMSKLLGREVLMEHVFRCVVENFAAVFDIDDIRWESADSLSKVWEIKSPCRSSVS